MAGTESEISRSRRSPWSGATHKAGDVASVLTATPSSPQHRPQPLASTLSPSATTESITKPEAPVRPTVGTTKTMEPPPEDRKGPIRARTNHQAASSTPSQTRAHSSSGTSVKVDVVGELLGVPRVDELIDAAERLDGRRHAGPHRRPRRRSHTPPGARDRRRALALPCPFGAGSRTATRAPSAARAAAIPAPGPEVARHDDHDGSSPGGAFHRAALRVLPLAAPGRTRRRHPMAWCAARPKSAARRRPARPRSRSRRKPGEVGRSFLCERRQCLGVGRATHELREGR